MSVLAGIELQHWCAQSRIFEYGEHRVHYWVAGDPEDEPLLLIHGFPTASWDWQYLWKPLASRYRLIACDMLGFGLSDKPRGHHYSLLEQANIEQALLAFLGVRQPVHVLAHDYGDSVAQELLARHEEGGLQLASCVFLNGGLFPETHHPVLVQKLLLSPLGSFVSRLFNRRKLEQNFARILGPNTQLSAQELEGLWQLIEHKQGTAVMHRLIRYMPERRQMRARWVQAMQQTQVPLRVIDGAFDPISGAHMVARYCELIPSANAVLLDNIGHYPQLEAPQMVLEHYLQFRTARGI